MYNGFQNPIVIPVRPGDSRLCCFHREDAVSFEQAEDGPGYLVVGRQAPWDAIARAAVRFNLDPQNITALNQSTAGQGEASHA